MISGYFLEDYGGLECPSPRLSQREREEGVFHDSLAMNQTQAGFVKQHGMVLDSGIIWDAKLLGIPISVLLDEMGL